MKPPTYQRIHETAEQIIQVIRSSILSPLRPFCGLSFLLRCLTDSETEIVAELVRVQLSYVEERALLVTQDRHRIHVDLVEIPIVIRELTPSLTRVGLHTETDTDLFARP